LKTNFSTYKRTRKGKVEIVRKKKMPLFKKLTKKDWNNIWKATQYGAVGGGLGGVAGVGAAVGYTNRKKKRQTSR
jgi:hypothetical protein